MGTTQQIFWHCLIPALLLLAAYRFGYDRGRKAVKKAEACEGTCEHDDNPYDLNRMD